MAIKRKLKTLARPSLAEILDRYSEEGELYKKLEDNKVLCYACGHRCVIQDGLRGICKVRYNRGGKLFVPKGYVAALQCDPTEKKPFFHVLPGSLTLTFGMLGCDYHCAYCFPAETPVVTNLGVLPIEEVFNQGKCRERREDAEISYPESLQAITESGSFYRVLKVFKHYYSGKMTVIKPYYFPEFRCTEDHRIYATKDPSGKNIEVLKAKDLTKGHFLVIPRNFCFSSDYYISAYEILGGLEPVFKIPKALTGSDVKRIMEAGSQGVSSKELGVEFGKDLSYMRRVRSKMCRSIWRTEDIGEATLEGGKVRFLTKKKPGIPQDIPLNEDFARLLGYYLAEGCVTQTTNSPNSYTLYFTLSPNEYELAYNIRSLIAKTLGLKAGVVKRPTSIAVTLKKASAALLFKTLCGERASTKRVPEVLFNVKRPIVESFLQAYIEGDGHIYPDGKVSVTTISRNLAYGIAWLALKLGYLPSLYESKLPEKKVEGRAVRQNTSYYTVVWYKEKARKHRYIETDRYYLIPLRSISTEEFAGYVYNLEVDKEHNYLANFFLVKNCQNWITSQALRDPVAGIEPMPVTAEEIVSLAKRYDAKMVASSYNEPLITAEWAKDIFTLAKKQGFKTAFISNGNATKEVLEYLRPFTDCYKVDLKSMQDRNYRKLGGLLSTVLETISRLVEMGFWVEVVTLVVPGFNDSDDELRAAARYLVSVSPDIPWHVTAFHKDYKMTDPENTPPETLIRAAQIGYEAGLRFVYAGNLPGMVRDYENTYCPDCHTLLVKRYGYRILDYKITPEGRCPNCNRSIPGIWW